MLWGDMLALNWRLNLGSPVFGTRIIAMLILPCSFLNEVGICDCEAGWQGTSCNISAEAALQGNVDEDSIASQCGTFDIFWYLLIHGPSQWLLSFSCVYLFYLAGTSAGTSAPVGKSTICCFLDSECCDLAKISGRLAGWYMTMTTMTTIQHIKPFQTQGLPQMLGRMVKLWCIQKSWQTQTFWVEIWLLGTEKPWETLWSTCTNCAKCSQQFRRQSDELVKLLAFCSPPKFAWTWVALSSVRTVWWRGKWKSPPSSTTENSGVV